MIALPILIVPRFTGFHIAQTNGLSRATVSRILRRRGLNRMRDLEPAIPLIRYEHPAPGDLLHLDIKQLGRFAGVVSRPDGRRRGKLHRGWEYVHVAIDDHSRIAFTQILPNFNAACAIAFLRAAVAYYSAWVLLSVACSPTTVTVTVPMLFTLRWLNLVCATASLVLIPRAPTAKPNASFEPPCANGLTPACIKTRNSDRSTFFPGFTITTGTALMVASTILLLSAAPVLIGTTS
jgi:hypothetical protein